ncbi:MAG TPA: SprT-like domain-containing protein [Fimbriimonadaceae bacterium]|jgi:predicted SprT family Zn-dependent metalloprotease
MSLEAAAQTLLQELCAQFPLGYTARIAWRGYRVSAGMAYYKTGIIGLSRIVLQDEAQMQLTLRHEYAHLLAYVRHGKAGAGHGEPWKQAMIDLGLPPKVRHNYEVQRNAKRQQVGYLCQRCGTVLVRSRRLPRRRRYIHNGCGGSIKYAWTRQVMPQAQAT